MEIQLTPWAETGLELERRTNVPEMTRHLGGVESDEAVVARHRRLLALAAEGTGRMLRVTLLPDGEVVGAVGYWEREWRGETVYEMGWKVLPGYQGRGIASAAVAGAVHRARDDGRRRWLHAYPGVDNVASNAICRGAGFTLLGETEFEYPKGSLMRCNDWRFDLAAPTTAP